MLLTVGLDEVPVEARLGAERLVANPAPETDQGLDVVLRGVVVLQLELGLKRNVAYLALEHVQVRVLVVQQVREHASADFALFLSGKLGSLWIQHLGVRQQARNEDICE